MSASPAADPGDDYKTGTIRVKITATKKKGGGRKPKKKEVELPPGWHDKQAIPTSPYKVQRGPLFIPPDVAEELGRFPQETITGKSKEIQQHYRDHTAGQSTEKAQTVPPIGKAHDEMLAAVAREKEKLEKAAAQAEKKALAALTRELKAKGKKEAAAAKKEVIAAVKERKAAAAAVEAAAKKEEKRQRKEIEDAEKEREAEVRAAMKDADEDAAQAERERKATEKERERYIKSEEAEIKKAQAEDKERERWQMAVPGARQAAASRAAKDALGRGYATNVPRPGGVDKKGLAAAAPGKEAKKVGIDTASGAFQNRIDEAVAKALLDPEGFFTRLSKKGIKGESYLRRFRTKTQRQNTYGLWFFESIQHNPANSIAKFVLNTVRGFGPVGQAVSAAIVGIASSVFVAQATIRNFAAKGLPLNIDYHRSVSEETVGLFTLEEQKRRDLGLAGVIADPTHGYRPVDGTEVYNTREIADSIRLTKLTQEEKARRLY